MLHRKWTVPVIACMLLCLLVSCTQKYNHGPQASNYGTPLSNDSLEIDRAYQTQQLVRNVTHDNTKVEYNSYLSNEVMALDGVNTAIVMVTNENAYVALLIDNTATGTRGSPLETNNQGTNVGIYNPSAPLSDYIPPHALHNGSNNYETSKDHRTLSHRFKQLIAQKIRSLQPDLLDVYISANRDFVNDMNNYAQVNWRGQSLQSHLPEFNQKVTEIFGTAQQLPNR